jgi:hypothetical protein
MARRWSAGDDAELTRLYGQGVPLRAIAAALGRSEDALVSRRALLGVAPRRAAPVWTTPQDRLICVATAAGIPASRVASTQGLSIDRVRVRRRHLLGARPAGRRYEPWEDQAIRDMWSDAHGLPHLAARLNRSPDAIRIRAQALGVHVPAPRRRWKASEDQTLRHGYAHGLTCAKISRALSGAHTPGAVSARARKLGLTSYAQTWSAQQDELLRQAITTSATVDDLALLLTRSPEAVRRRTQKLGLPAPRHGASAASGRRWTRAEDVILIENPGMQPGVLARRLRRSDHAVSRRQRLLGVRTGSRSPHYAPVNGTMSPAEERLILRELTVDAEKGGGRLLALADRLGRSPAELRQRIRAVGAAS